MLEEMVAQLVSHDVLEFVRLECFEQAQGHHHQQQSAFRAHRGRIKCQRGIDIRLHWQLDAAGCAGTFHDLMHVGRHLGRQAHCRAEELTSRT